MEENYKLPKLNLLVIGKTGVGKSTLLNSLFGKNLALTGSGEPITQDIDKFAPEGWPIAIYDTPGMELGGKHSAENLLNDVTCLIQNKMTRLRMRRIPAKGVRNAIYGALPSRLRQGARRADA